MLLAESLYLLACERISNTAAYNNKGLPALFDFLGNRFNFVVARNLSGNEMYSFSEKFSGIIVTFTLNVLAESDCRRTCVSRVRENSHSICQSRHNHLGTGNTVKITCYRSESVVCRACAVMELLNLLKNGVGLSACKCVAHEKEKRNIVNRGSSRRRNHIRRTRAD